MKVQSILLLVLFSIITASDAQQNTKMKQNADTIKAANYDKIIDDFVISTKDNLSFQNGMNVVITKPKDDKDALTKGFKLMQYDEEQNGNWKILFAKDIIWGKCQDEHNNEETTRAVLYEYKNKQYIVLYRKQKADEYYFRIHHPSQYSKQTK